MLRASVALLLAANLLFFAWAHGWLAPLLQPPHQGDREPERLAAQLRPETIRVQPVQATAAVAAAAASAAAPAAAVCLEAGPFDEADVGIAEASLLGAGVAANAWVRSQVQLPPTWLVYIGRFNDVASMRARLDDLKRTKVTAEELRAPPELAPGLVLSRHDTEAAAAAALAQWQQRGARGAKVVALPPPPLQYWLRAAQADAELQATLLALKPPAFGAAFAPCPAGR